MFPKYTCVRCSFLWYLKFYWTISLEYILSKSLHFRPLEAYWTLIAAPKELQKSELRVMGDSERRLFIEDCSFIHINESTTQLTQEVEIMLTSCFIFRNFGITHYNVISTLRVRCASYIFSKMVVYVEYCLSVPLVL